MCALVQTESKIEMKTNSKSAKSHLIRKFRAKETKCERDSKRYMEAKIRQQQQY